MTTSLSKSYEYGDYPSNKAALVVAGFNGNVSNVENAALYLERIGYNVFAYDYSSDVFYSGEPEYLTGLVDEITEDFKDRTTGYEVIQPTGVSIGAGIAWATQKRAEEVGETQFIKPGIYAAAGANSADGIFSTPFSNPVMYGLMTNIRKAFINNGYSQEDLRNIWKEVHQPPKTGFAIALGGLDYVVKYPSIMKDIRKWQDEDKIPIVTKTIKHLGHTGTIKWFNAHMPSMVEIVKKV